MFAYCGNESVGCADKSGKDAVILLDADGVTHVGALIQDGDGNWWHFYWGTYDNYTRILCFFDIDVEPMTWCKPYEGEISLDKINMDPNYPGDYEDMIYLVGDFSGSVDIAKNIQNTKELYNLYSNNCTQVTLRLLGEADTVYKWLLRSAKELAIPLFAFYEVKNEYLEFAPSNYKLNARRGLIQPISTQ